MRSFLPDRNSIATRLSGWFLLIALVPCVFLLAVAAYRTNRIDLARWLRRRAELLANPAVVAAGRPVLEEMFRQAP